MFVTITTGEQFAGVEVSEDMEVENFIALARIEIPHYNAVPMQSFILVVNGQQFLTNENGVLKRQIKDLGIVNDDVVYVLPAANTAREARPPPARQPSSGQPARHPSQPSVDLGSLVSGLVKGIKVPPKGQNVAGPSVKSAGLDIQREASRKFFEMLKDEKKRESIKDMEAGRFLLEAYEKNPNNFEGFHQAFLQHHENEKRKIHLMHDPTSAEGQKYIQELIERENIEFSHQFALEHMPEAFVQVHMLYIRMKINGHSVLAFIDSGAQVSIMSEACARRVNIMRLLDTRYQAIAQGVGGQQKFKGRVHACEVQVEGHIFPCPFNIMADRSMDILIGLNILRRHQCSIDLKKNVLRFGDGTETPFLEEEEYKREKEIHDKELPAEEPMETEIEVDTAKLAHLIGLGFEEEDARNELIRCRNDLETSANNLFAKKTEQQ